MKITENTTLAELQLAAMTSGVTFISTRVQNRLGGSRKVIAGLQALDHPTDERFIMGEGDTLAEALGDAFEQLRRMTGERLLREPK